MVCGCYEHELSGSGDVVSADALMLEAEVKAPPINPPQVVTMLIT